jgi:hypothetical protein
MPSKMTSSEPGIAAAVAAPFVGDVDSGRADAQPFLF